MRVLVTSTRHYDKLFLDCANQGHHQIQYLESILDQSTAPLANGFPAICCFVDDLLDASVLEILERGGTRLLALRSTGFNHVDLKAAERLGMTVMRVQDYSPYSVAEFALGLILTLNRHLHKAYNRVREENFLLDGLMGFDMHGKTVGIVGTGKIGLALAKILNGMGCLLLGHDIHENPECLSLGMKYVDLDTLLSQSLITSLHLPLTPETYHLINADNLKKMPECAILINTSRGALIDTKALIDALKAKHLGGAGLDVYEEETALYFRNFSDEIITDDLFSRLLTFPNVIVTGHQAFFTEEAMKTIAETTIANLSDYESGRTNKNIVSSTSSA